MANKGATGKKIKSKYGKVKFYSIGVPIKIWQDLGIDYAKGIATSAIENEHEKYISNKSIKK